MLRHRAFAVKSAREVRYAVACDGTVERLRELAYQDAVRDAAKIADDFFEAQTHLWHTMGRKLIHKQGKQIAAGIAERIRGLKRSYGDGHT